MNNLEFDKLVKKNFEEQPKNSFLKKVNIVDTTEEDIEEKPVSQLVIADAMDDGSFYDTIGSFEFVPCSYPNIKTGATLIDQTDERLELTATNLVVAVSNRLNALIALSVYGGGEMGGSILKTEVPEDIHRVVDGDDGIEAINIHNTYMKNVWGTKYDRITLNGVLLTMLTGEVKSVQAKKLLKELTGLKVDIDNGYYNERTNDGGVRQRDFIPNNKVVLSSTKNDNSDIFYLANLTVNSEEDSVDGKYGVRAYIQNDIAYAVLRAVPVLKDKAAFATITFKDKI